MGDEQPEDEVLTEHRESAPPRRELVRHALKLPIGVVAALAVTSPDRMRRIMSFLDPDCLADYFNSCYQPLHGIWGNNDGDVYRLTRAFAEIGGRLEWQWWESTIDGRRILMMHANDRIRFVSLQVIAGSKGPQSAELELTIDGETKVGNGVQLYDAGTGVITTLDSDTAAYKGLAWRADAAGNLVYRMTENNFNAAMATAADLVIAEVEDREAVAVDRGSSSMWQEEMAVTTGMTVNNNQECPCLPR